MNRKYEGILLVLLLAVSIAGCRKAQPQETQSPKEPTVGVKEPLGPVENGTVTSEPGKPNVAGSPRVSTSGTRPEVNRPADDRNRSQSRLSAPPRPKADEVATGKYTAPGGSVAEIEGVCRVTEDSVSCWSPDGTKNEDLEKRVEEGLKAGNGMGGSSNVSFQYKKKNRVVVVKTTQPAARTDGPSASIYLQGVGDSMYGGGGYINLRFDGMRTFRPGEPMVNYQARSVAVDPSVNSASAFFMVTETVPERGTLELRAGASCTIQDAGIKVVSIAKGLKTPSEGSAFHGFYGDQNGPVWTIKVVETKPTSRCHLSLVVTGLFVDASGKLVSQQEYSKELSRLYSRPPKPGSRYSPPPRPKVTQVMLRQTFGGRDGSYYLLNADPKAVKKLSVFASRSKLVELKGIRLDPR